MLKDLLKDYNIILASGSPRRHQFLKDLDLDFEVKLKPIEEIYPNHLQKEAITDYLSVLKSKPFIKNFKPNDILITSDTIVWLNNKALGKPKDVNDAFNMLKALSDQTHDVITSVCYTTLAQQIIKHATTKVTFRKLEDTEIWHYIDNYKPFDKAGAYGIQEWIGAIGITMIKGSYNNVVGLPTHQLYETLINIAQSD